MKPTKLLLFLLGIMMAACGQQSEQDQEQETEVVTQTPEMPQIDYPEKLQASLEVHGGLDSWKAMTSLYFEIPGEAGSEKHYVALDSRNDRVENPEATMGFNGDKVWMVADTSTYKRDPVFYHNLMFYFYAMPFVLADPGIIYEETAPLEFEGVSYPGVAIAYEDGVGASSKDEYFIHFDPESGQMAWLGYTVTYFSGEKSDKVSWIRYNDWQSVEGLLLPNTISWYQLEEGLPTEVRNTVAFEAVAVSPQPHDPEMFNPPSGAIIK
jgi:hypothetical protein